MQNLKSFIDTVRLSSEVHKDLKGIVAHFAFILTIFRKYEDTLTACGLEGEQADQLKTLGWLLYIMARVVILKSRNEIVESACLLIAVLTLVIVNSRSDSVRFAKLGASPSQQHVKKFLCDMYRLKNSEAVDCLAGSFAKLLQQLVNSDDLRGDPQTESSGVADFSSVFDQDRIQTNLRKLNTAYQSAASLDGIDERSFILSETKITTPARLTPFARQGEANALATPHRDPAGQRKTMRYSSTIRREQ